MYNAGFSYIAFLEIILITSACITGSLAHREEECVEVGFARSSYLTVDQGFQAAKEQLLELWKTEDEAETNIYQNLSPILKNVTRAAIMLEKTSKNILGLIRKTRVGKRCPEEWLLKGLEKHVTPLIQMDKELAESLGLVMSFRCLVGSPYPNVDGTCVNEEGPDMGAVGSKFLRLIPPVSGKGGFDLRASVNKEKSLPNARKVAQLIRRHMVKPKLSALFTEMSHFLALDSINIPESPLTEGVNCCDRPDHTDCAPIFLDEKDPMFSTIKCINYKRSSPAQAILGHRESLTVVSTYIDATPVYGATNEEAFRKKEGYFGYLKYPQSIEEREKTKDKKKNCQFPKSFQDCFGIDPKENNFLENLRLLLTMEHNYIADTLAEINPHFDDSLLYNEARRILIAEFNAIVYGEFVPVLLGRESAEKHFLLPGSQGPAAGYIAEVNPGIITSHALGSSRNPSMLDEWKAEWGGTDLLSPLHFNSVRDDPYQDLLAMDIQRGRDHGVPQYGSWRGFCDSGRQLNNWEDVASIFNQEIADELKDLYNEEVGDLDLLLALLEPPEEGMVVGKIFSCILVDQFARLKTGNRLYWEHDTSALTVEQRDVLKSQSSAASLLCRHFALSKVAQNPFREISDSNPEVECSEFKRLNLTAWVDTSLIEVMKQKKEEDEKKRQEEIKENARLLREEEKKKEETERNEKEKKKEERRREEEKREEKKKKEEKERNEKEKKKEERRREEKREEERKLKEEILKKEEERKEKLEKAQKKEKEKEKKKEEL